MENPESPEPQSPHPISARSGTGQWAQKTPGAYRLPDRTGQGRGAQRTWNSRSNLEAVFSGETPLSRSALDKFLHGNGAFIQRPDALGNPGAWAFSDWGNIGGLGTSDRTNRSAHGTHSDPEFLAPRASSLEPPALAISTDDLLCVCRHRPSSHEPETEMIPRLPDPGGEELGSDGDADLGILDPICLVAGHA